MEFTGKLNSMRSVLINAAAIIVFYFAGVLLYQPKALSDLLTTPFNIAIVSAIILVAMFMSRMLLWLLRKVIKLNVFSYAIWCLFEALFMSAFVALFLVLMQRDNNYFAYLVQSFHALGTWFLFPYVIVYLGFCLRFRPKTAEESKEKVLRFYDSRHLLKFTTSAETILYIKSDENYLDIYYLENGKVKMYELRNSMKSVEGLTTEAGFVRTHRSYMINPLFLKLVAKGEEGHYYADLGADGCDSVRIPVSKKFYASVATLL